MEKYDDLVSQLYENNFKNATFGIFNFIDGEGFVDEVCSKDKEKYGIEDFEYLKFQISEKQKNGIKFSKKEIVQYFKSFKSYVENELQKDSISKLRIYLIKESGSLIAVKLKKFSLCKEKD